MDIRRLMDQAVGLAMSTSPHPNPRVGALVVDDRGTVLGAGRHDGPGHDHAEVAAIEAAGERAVGQTLVVTLEPCVHTGRTPACVDRIIQAGLARVVVGALDPDPRVDGNGVRRLAEAGVQVVVADNPGAAEALDPGYFHHRRTGRPRVLLKLAATLDGQVAASDGTSRWITCEAARADAHRLRASCDAVMVGAGTVRRDRPSLTVRLPEGESHHQPRPVVVAGSGRLPTDAPFWSRNPIVLAPTELDVPGDVMVASGGSGVVDLAAGLGLLGSAGIVDLMVEGGPRLSASLLRLGLIDRGVYYLAGILAGGRGYPSFEGTFETLSEAVGVRILEVVRVGSDLRVDFELEER